MPRDEELQAISFAWYKQMEAKNMTLAERHGVVGTLVGLHLMLTAVALDESLNIISNRFFARVLEVNENSTLPFAQSINLPIKP